MSQSRLKWGILGTSFISRVVADAIWESETGVVTAVGTRVRAKADEFIASFSREKSISDKFIEPRCYGNLAEMLEDKDIDAVYIGLPNKIHKEWTLRALRAGKHVLCEKPFVISDVEMREVIAESKKHPALICMEALMYRYHPFIASLKKLITEDRILGDVKLYTASYTADIEKKANPVEGGSIRNLGCYPVSLVRYLAGTEPVEIIGMGSINPITQNDNHASMILKFANNALATISTADNLEMAWTFKVIGTKGSIDVITNPWKPEMENKYILTLNGNAPRQIIHSTEKTLYAYQIDKLGQAVANQQFSHHGGVSLGDSLGNVTVLETWRKRVRLSQRLTVSVSNLGQFGSQSGSRPTTADEAKKERTLTPAK